MEHFLQELMDSDRNTRRYLIVPRLQLLRLEMLVFKWKKTYSFQKIC